MQTKDTPNPNSLMFLPGVPVMGEHGPRDFPPGADTARAPLAKCGRGTRAGERV